MKNILIITNPDDQHAVLVAEALKRKGANAILWQTSDFPNGATETVHFDGPEARVSIEGAGTFEQLRQIDSVWHRRPQILWGLTPVVEEDREFTEQQCEIFREGLVFCLAPDAFWVNPPATRKLVRSKLRQHKEAALAGLRLPETIYTNDPDAVRAFIRKHGEVVYKPLFPRAWGENGEGFGIYTTRIDESGLVADPLLQAVPGIYQEIVPKAYELRVIVMGHRVFVAKIHSQETAAGQLDWRLAGPELLMEASELDGETTACCLEMMRRLDLVYGAIDFIVTPSGEHIFLEVNQMGQFGFVEDFTGLPLVDAMCELLIQGRREFEWSEDRVEVRMRDLQDLVERKQEKIAENHLKRPMGVLYPPRALVL